MARLLLRDLTPGTAYKLQFRAVDSNGIASDWSRRFDLNVSSDTVAPDTPSWAAQDWVINGDTFVATWVAINFTLQQNIDFDHYEIELTDGTSTTVLRTNNTSYTLTFDQNRILFGSPKPTVSARVRSVDKVGNASAWSSQKSATNPAPSAPASITTTALLESVKVDWPAVSDIDVINYKLQVSTTSASTGFSDIYNGPDLSYVHGTIQFATDHWFRIYAVDKFGTLSSATTSGAIRPKSQFTADTTPPAAPAITAGSSSISNNANGIGSVATLVWTQTVPTPDDLANFEIRYRKTGDTNWTSAGSFDKADRQATIPLPLAYTNYDFQIRSFDWSNNTAGWTATTALTSPSNAAPANVTGLTSTAGKDSITYSWTATADQDIKNYEVTFSTSSTFASGNTTFLTGNSTSLTVGGLTAGQTYYARVRAVDTGGNTSAAWSGTDTRTTGTFPTTPLSDGVVPAAGNTPDVMTGLGYLYVKWAPVTTNASAQPQTDTVTYEVHLSTTTGFTPSGATKVTEVSGTSSIVDHLPGTNTALTYGTPYYIKIVPKDRDGAGAASAQGSGTPSKVASGDVTSIGADLIVPGTGFVSALQINTGGSIQSSNWSSGTAGWKISPSGAEFNDSGTSLKADAIKAGTLGGAGGSGLIDIATGTSLRLNGGKLYSNTYNGAGLVYDPAATAGFYLGNDGLVIAQGKVKAEALSGGTFNAGTISIAAGGAITGGSWSLSNTGLSIPNGGIQAAALNIQVGNNLMPALYADFEGPASAYPANMASGTNVTTTISTAQRWANSQSLLVTNTASALRTTYFGASTTDYNIPVLPSTKYTVSAYLYNASGAAVNGFMGIKAQDGTVVNGGLSAYANTAGWVRYQNIITTPATATSIIVTFSLNNNGTFYVDGVQFEQMMNQNLTGAMPSPWSPPGSTIINGALIKTGAIQSTSPALDVNAQPISGLPAWKIDTAGNAVFGDALIRGRLIMGITGDYENSTTTATNADGTTYTYEDTAKLAGIGSIQSYNYKPGEAGWAIRSNGYAEFLQLKANSIASTAISAVSPDKLSPGTMTADIIVGASIRSVEKDTLYITQKSRTGSVSTVTLADNHSRMVGDQIQVTMDTADAAFDTPGKTFATITAVTSNTISYTSPSGSGTIGATAATGSLYVEGRSVTMSSDGVTLFQNDGISRIIDLPTDPTLPAFFSGDVDASSLTIRDFLLLQGQNNAVAAGSVFTLNASIVKPSGTPTLNFSWDYVGTWLSNTYSAWKSGLWWDGTRYLTTNAFFGAQIFGTTATGAYSSNNTAADDAGGEGQQPYGVIKANDGKFYVLVNDAGDGLWKVRRYATTGTGFSTLEASWTYNEATYFGVTATEWKIDGWNGSALKDPVIGYGTPDGGTNYYIYIARCNKAGKIIVSRYATDGTGVVNTTTNITDNQNLKGINVGNFDFGSARVIVTTEGNATKPSTNYSVSTTGFHQTQETFQSPNNQKTWGICWNGTNFVTLTQNNRLFTHTALALNGTNVWYAKASWYDGNNSRTVSVSNISGNGTTVTVTTATNHGYVAGDTVYIAGTIGATLNNNYYTIASAPTSTTFTVSSSQSGSGASGGTVTNEWETPLGSYAQATVLRRSKLTISAGNVPIGAGTNIPDRARFYFSNTAGGGGSYYLQTNPNASGTQIFTSTPAFSGTTTTLTAFPAGTPAKIVSNNGLLELNSGGYAIFGSTTDVNASAGNTPPLRIGNIAGAHARMDANEIQAMASDTTTTSFTINAAGGDVYLASAGTTRVNAILTQSNITMNGGSFFTPGEIHTNTSGTAGGLFDDTLNGGGLTAASINANGRLVRTTSSIRYKEVVKPMSLSDAKKALELESVTFKLKDEKGIKNRRTHPGFIAEQAHESGAKLWVNYDKDGRPDGFKYSELTSAHNMLIKELYSEIESLKAEVASLRK